MAQVLLEGLSNMNGTVYAKKVGFEFSEEGMASEGMCGSSRKVSRREGLF